MGGFGVTRAAEANVVQATSSKPYSIPASTTIPRPEESQAWRGNLASIRISEMFLLPLLLRKCSPVHATYVQCAHWKLLLHSVLFHPMKYEILMDY